MESTGPGDLVQKAPMKFQRTALWKNYLNLFSRPLWIQFIILICWFCGFTLIVYYLIYEDLIIELVHQGILPENLDYFPLLSVGLFVISILFLILTKK